jgi:hypothetical protein
MSRQLIWLVAFTFPLSTATLSLGQTADHKQTNKSKSTSSPSSSATVVGEISSIRLNDEAYSTNPSVQVLGNVRFSVEGNGTRVTIEAFSADQGLCIYNISISGSMMNAPRFLPELIMETAEHKTYSVKLTTYPNPGLSIAGGAAIKVSGKLVGTTLYARAIETVKPPTEKMCIPREPIGKP